MDLRTLPTLFLAVFLAGGRGLTAADLPYDVVYGSAQKMAALCQEVGDGCELYCAARPKAETTTPVAIWLEVDGARTELVRDGEGWYQVPCKPGYAGRGAVLRHNQPPGSMQLHVGVRAKTDFRERATLAELMRPFRILDAAKRLVNPDLVPAERLRYRWKGDAGEVRIPPAAAALVRPTADGIEVHRGATPEQLALTVEIPAGRLSLFGDDSLPWLQGE